MKMMTKSLLLGFFCAGSTASMAEVAAPEAFQVAPDTANRMKIMARPQDNNPLPAKEAFKRYTLSSCLHFAFKSEELRTDAAESIGYYYRTGNVSLNQAAKIKSLVDSMLGQPLSAVSSRKPVVEPLIVRCINLSNSEAVENLFAAPESPNK